ncbi:MAG: TIGR01777 family protein [Chitinophagaceae bacterium]|nr:MAG: TIGR01777 family protein [Chitinophagaceae bacterium]
MKQKILITGGSGLVGTFLGKMLTDKGYEVGVLSRNPDINAQPKQFQWNPKKAEIDAEALKNVFGVIHLAGAGIADKRWTENRKKEIISSRVETTNFLSDLIKEGKFKPQVFISASGIDYYGDKKDKWINEEEKPPKNSFISDVCISWENAVLKVAEAGVRTAIFRMGIVLAKDGGALEKIDMPIKMGIGAYLGDGKQYYTWIHIEDLARMFLHTLETEKVEGVYNAGSPNPVTNKEMVSIIAKVLDKRHLLAPTPAFVLKIALGEMASILLSSQRASVEKITQTGFEFKYDDAESALKEIYGKS